MSDKVDGIKNLLGKKFNMAFVRIKSVRHDLWASNIGSNGIQYLAFGLTDDNGMFLSVLIVDEFGNISDHSEFYI